MALHKGHPGDKLDILRLQKFYQKVIVSKSVVGPKVLPQTSASATYHIQRVYLQVQQWMGQDHMNPEHWGWYGQGGHYFPSLTDKDPAPTDLLEIVRCNWKACCNTQRCTCRKHGMECYTGVGCESMLTICWMMVTKTNMMTRSKWQFWQFKFSLLHLCDVCVWVFVGGGGVCVGTWWNMYDRMIELITALWLECPIIMFCCIFIFLLELIWWTCLQSEWKIVQIKFFSSRTVPLVVFIDVLLY